MPRASVHPMCNVLTNQFNQLNSISITCKGCGCCAQVQQQKVRMLMSVESVLEQKMQEAAQQQAAAQGGGAAAAGAE
jgi:CO dehydrogenase/acetyl-CoA synthase alpha subunit